MDILGKIASVENINGEDIISFPEMKRWDEASIGVFEKLFICELIRMTNAKVIVETGTWKGDNAQYLSEFLLSNGLEGKVYSFDFGHVIDKIMEENHYLSRVDNVQFIKGRLPESLRDFLRNLREPVDFAIIDSAHNYEQVLSELKTLHPHLREGAYVFCHDYLEHKHEKFYEQVVYGIDRFAKKYNYNLLPLNHGELVWGAAILRKPLVKKMKNKAIRFRLGSLNRRMKARLKRR